MTRYRAEPGLRISGNDGNGDVHRELVFNARGELEVPEDAQEYALTLAHVLDAGLIKVADPEPEPVPEPNVASPEAQPEPEPTTEPKPKRPRAKKKG